MVGNRGGGGVRNCEGGYGYGGECNSEEEGVRLGNVNMGMKTVSRSSRESEGSRNDGKTRGRTVERAPRPPVSTLARCSQPP